MLVEEKLGQSTRQLTYTLYENSHNSLVLFREFLLLLCLCIKSCPAVCLRSSASYSAMYVFSVIQRMFMHSFLFLCMPFFVLPRKEQLLVCMCFLQRLNIYQSGSDVCLRPFVRYKVRSVKGEKRARPDSGLSFVLFTLISFT